MKSFRCRDDGEMHGKGPTPTIACASVFFLQAAVHFPAFHTASRALRPIPCSWSCPCRALRGNPCGPLIRAVHFPPFPTARRSCAVHFVGFLAARGAILCKESGEVHVKKPARGLFRRALPPFSCSSPCTSPDSLHEFAAMQGFGGSARHRAGIEGKCMAARPPPTRPLVHFPKTLQPDARPKPAPGRPTEGVSRFRRRAAVRRGGWEIAVEDAVGEPPSGGRPGRRAAMLSVR